jgi:phenylacetate-CoA ligase
MNIITPALEIKDALSSIEELFPHYEQVILAGYPPFIKDLLDAGSEADLPWEKMNLGFTVAGEAVTEELRDYFMDKAAIHDPGRIVNIYGTADAGIVAHESPVSIMLRRLISAKPKSIETLFGRPVLPTLAMYDPVIRYFEEVEGNLVFTAPSGIPLIRYNIKDAGGIVSDFSSMVNELSPEDTIANQLSSRGYDINQWQYPLLYVHGRSDFTATLYAVLIYPENVKSALLKDPLSKLASGKFVMETKNNSELDQYLEVTIELKQKIEPTKELEDLFIEHIVDTLQSQNAEYRKLKNSVGEKAIPKVIIRPFGEAAHFPKANKHRWVPKK